MKKLLELTHAFRDTKNLIRLLKDIKSFRLEFPNLSKLEKINTIVLLIIFMCFLRLLTKDLTVTSNVMFLQLNFWLSVTA